MFEDFAKADQDRQCDSPQLKVVDEFLEVDATRGIFVGVDPDVTVGAYGKVALAPTGDVVKLGRFSGGPAVGRFAHRGRIYDGDRGFQRCHEPSVCGKSRAGASDSRVTEAVRGIGRRTHYEDMATSSKLSAAQEILERRIYLIRGQKVMLDRDLAELYQVPTKRLNEQVRRNLSRFPKDFMLALTKTEEKNLRSQIATSSWGGRGTNPLAFR